MCFPLGEGGKKYSTKILITEEVEAKIEQDSHLKNQGPWRKYGTFLSPEQKERREKFTGTTTAKLTYVSLILRDKRRIKQNVSESNTK